MAKSTRRANGEGHFKKLPDGRWKAVKLVQRPDGEYQQVKAEGKTRAAAAERLAEKVQKIAAGAEATRAPTMAEHLESWYRNTFCPKARPSSRRTYRRLLDRQIIPHLGAIRIDKLRGPKLRNWLADLERQGLAPKTISMARNIVRQALEQAVDDALIAVSPLTRKIKGPKIPKSGGKALSVDQARALLAAARGNRLELAIRLALGLGLRRGEVCGLRWEDVDLSTGRLTVAGQLVYTPGQGKHWTPLTKSDAGRRSFRLPATLTAALRWHQERQRGERAAMGWKPNPYVFISVQNGEALNPNSLYDAFKRIAAAVGLDEHRFHDLRHAAASFLLAEGVPVKTVGAVLGHARTSTTLDIYGHLLPGAADDAPDRVARLLDDPPPPVAGDDDTREVAG